ncbi:isopenicillin N synthase family dioxygenase [Aspergillus ibericus CBS 121593]|uniref:Oxidoreductase n=1 Tax=Aspergillus ibericus CBS 121593 TaxID=1448316 RepID=A0A395GKJ0_9EURO|nr:oxidoreductase [Aspergillus ibericus CBS 121593]RAK96011.1 oxidoreductase [Aspergillus ibericus CBS 121593]
MATAPPVIDFGPYYGDDVAKKAALVQQVRQACERHGFFQIINHQIPSDLPEAILQQAREIFSLPLEVKEKYSREIDPVNLGYERLRAQTFGEEPSDLKEGFFLCRDFPPGHPLIGRFSLGLNKYPTEMPDVAGFQSTVNRYHTVMADLALDIFRVLAQTLDLEEHWFDSFCHDSVNIMRLLRYPPQPAGGRERGIGAHTDFGGLTILLQDDQGGLQVWDRESSQWADADPVPGALVVNLGNMMMRWTNDRYVSNLHRVINTSGQERYSVPFFVSGNPDYLVECIPSCKAATEAAKYPPITVEEWLEARLADTYGGVGVGELSKEVASATH